MFFVGHGLLYPSASPNRERAVSVEDALGIGGGAAIGAATGAAILWLCSNVPLVGSQIGGLFCCGVCGGGMWWSLSVYL